MRNPVRLALAALLPFLGIATEAAAQDNLLVIIADDLGVDMINAYQEGGDLPPTPNLDALANGGIMFRNFWATTFCSPTRAQMHTGRHPYRTGVGRPIQRPDSLELRNVLPIRETTFPEMLDAHNSGYSHAYIGKWHLGDFRNGGALSPNLSGWGHFAGMVAGGVNNYYQWWRIENGTNSSSTIYSTTHIVDDALDWITQQSGPWCCWVGFNAPHTPYHAPPQSLHTQNLAGENVNVNARPFYKAMVEAMDTEIGRLIDTLGPSVMAQTNVVFLGDNGTQVQITVPPFVAGHGKTTPYEGGVKTPLIMTGPAVGGSARSEFNLVSAVDLFPTLLELCGVTETTPPYTVIDGVSMASLLAAGGQPPIRQYSYSDMFWNNRGTGFAVARSDRYKVIRRYGFTPPIDEFYDLQADPFELTDLLQVAPLPPSLQTEYDDLIDEIGRVRRVGGSFTPYGSATCTGTAGVPTIGSIGTPRITQTYTIDLQNAPASAPAYLMIGASNTNWRGTPLPFDLSSIGGGANCFIENSGDLVVPTITSGSGDAQMVVTLPGLSTLIQASIYHSWLIADSGANPLGLISTGGLQAICGTQFSP